MSGSPEHPPPHLRTDDLESIIATLRHARSRFAAGQYGGADDDLAFAHRSLGETLLQGASRERLKEFLALYYTTAVMLKVAHSHEAMFEDHTTRRAVQVLMRDTSGALLIQRRGPFKRLFPDSLTVSANAKLSRGVDCRQAAAQAVQDETGLRLGPERFQLIGREGQFESLLQSHDFLALTTEEAVRLEELRHELARSARLAGVLLEYSPAKRCLCAFSRRAPTGPDDALTRVVQDVEERSGVPPVYPQNANARHTLLVLRLSDAERAQVSAAARKHNEDRDRALASLPAGATASALRLLDSDQMQFMTLHELLALFERRPTHFALDLIGPYLEQPRTWGPLSPEVLDVRDPLCAEPEVAGGKGSNTHFLTQIKEQTLGDGLSLAPTRVVTTGAFEWSVLRDAKIREELDALEDAGDENEMLAIADRVRKLIRSHTVRPDVGRGALAAFRELDGDVAVRSSATIEDGKEFAAAGLADSFLHIVNEDQLDSALKEVWASLFSDGFVLARAHRRLSHRDARMAVLIQRFVDARAAGVALSIHPASWRPVFTIEAQTGLGEGVVQGRGNPDRWLIGLDAGVILERYIAPKSVEIVPRVGGGVYEREVSNAKPSLHDEEVLSLAKVVRHLLAAYRAADRATELDVEFAVAKGVTQQLVVLQARPKPLLLDASNGEPVVRVRTVQTALVPPGTDEVPLPETAVAVSPGAVTGTLRVIAGTESAGSADVRPGDILVVHHTDNSWSGCFAALSAAITEDGGITSHAALNCQELHLPCVVGATGAVQALRRHDGDVVTFDAGERKLFVGEVPIVEIERSVDVWIKDPEDPKRVERLWDHEIQRPWALSLTKRPDVFIEDYEGRWRRRSSHYGWFQLSYYYRAWDVLTQWLNRSFEGRRKWELETQEMEVKQEIKHEGKGRYLFQRMKIDDPRSICRFLLDVEGFDLSDAEALFQARWNGLREFGSFMAALRRIDASNVEQVVDSITTCFAWMHFGFWLDAVVDLGFARPQLNCIHSSFHGRLRSAAQHDLLSGEFIASHRDDVPAGSMLHLSRRKDYELYGALERIRSRTSVALVFAELDAARLAKELAARDAELLELIESWSMRFKRTSEELRDRSDAEGYLSDLRLRLQEGNSASLQLVADYYATCVGRHQERDLGQIRAGQPLLFSLIRSQARILAARGRDGSWEHSRSRDRARLLNAVTECEIDARLDEAMRAIEEQASKMEEMRREDRLILDSFPTLERTLALLKSAAMLREDGHHLIVPDQRKLARLMRETARNFTTVLEMPENIFEISGDELIGLLLDSSPAYISRTFERLAILERAERRLRDSWGDGPDAALEEFARATARACEILDEQAAGTQVPRVASGYRAERERLLGRIQRLERRADLS